MSIGFIFFADSAHSSPQHFPASGEVCPVDLGVLDLGAIAPSPRSIAPPTPIVSQLSPQFYGKFYVHLFSQKTFKMFLYKILLVL